jgi:hypothetical protein
MIVKIIAMIGDLPVVVPEVAPLSLSHHLLTKVKSSLTAASEAKTLGIWSRRRRPVMITITYAHIQIQLDAFIRLYT